MIEKLHYYHFFVSCYVRDPFLIESNTCALIQLTSTKNDLWHFLILKKKSICNIKISTSYS